MPLPSGTLTLLFTDIEGSTRLLDRLGERYAQLLAAHHAIIPTVLARHAGHEVETEGDAFFACSSGRAMQSRRQPTRSAG